MKIKRILLLIIGLVCVLWCTSALATPVCGTEGSEYPDCWPDWSQQYYDEEYHWYVCQHCGAPTEKSAHYSYCPGIGYCNGCYAPYSGDNVNNHVAYCDDPGVCSQCHKRIEDIATGYHGDLEYGWNATHHWEICQTCGVTIRQKPHYVVCGQEDQTVCNDCGAEVTNPDIHHTWEYVAKPDGTGHRMMCTECDAEKDEAHWVSCENSDNTVCDACDEVAVCETIHSTDGYSDCGTKTHWTTCLLCFEKLDEQAHYTNEGDPAGICSYCGAVTAQATGKLIRLADTAEYYDAPGGTAQFTYADAGAALWKNLLDYYGEPVVSGGSTWYQVSEKGGLYYLRSDDVKVLDEPAGYMLVYSYYANVRNEPAGNKIYTYADYNEILLYYGQPVQSVTEDPWYLVTCGNVAGYVRKDDIAFCDSEGEVIPQDPETCKHNYAAGGTACVDEVYHANTCFLCGKLDMENLYMHQGDCQSTTCDVCDAENVKLNELWHGHTTMVSIDKKTHGVYCLNCETIYYTEEHYADCAEKVCYYCDETDCDVEKYSHNSWDYVSMNEQKHAYSCLNCGYCSYTEEHTSTCTEPNICRWCDAEYEGIRVTRHESTAVQHDETHHWWECVTCGKITYGEKEEHYSGCEEPNVCWGCDAIYDGSNVIMHSNYDTQTYHYDANYHWYECSDCGGQAQKMEHKASCTLKDVCDYCLMANYSGGNVFHDKDYYDATGRFVWKDYTSHDYYCGWCGELAENEEHWTYYNGAVCEDCAGRVADENGLLIIPADAKIISAQAFYGASSMKDVILPEGLETIESKAFANSSVNTVNLPSTLKSIADDAFEGCSIIGVVAEKGTYAYTWAQEHGLID